MMELDQHDRAIIDWVYHRTFVADGVCADRENTLGQIAGIGPERIDALIRAGLLSEHPDGYIGFGNSIIEHLVIDIQKRRQDIEHYWGALGMCAKEAT